MGNWKNRPRLRRHYKDTPDRPPAYDGTEQLDSGCFQGNVPLWEKKFCTLIGKVPWRKVVDAKRYAHCHSNIVNWDASAAEEAFHNAKRRFWAEINGLQCDIAIPDPDMYIDEVDWNPHIDPELIKDLEKTYFNPDGSETYRNTNNGASHPSEYHKLSPAISENPWEQYSRQCNEASKGDCNPWECNPWDWGYHVNDLKNGDGYCNPWGHDGQSNTFQKPNGWGTLGNNVWGGDQDSNQYNQSKVWGDNYISKEHNRQDVASGWHGGWGVPESKPQNWNKSRNMISSSIDHRGHSSTQNAILSKDRGWRDSAGSSQGHGHWANKNGTPRNMDLRTGGRASGDWNDSYRKRGGDHQNSLRCKSSRFEVVDNSMGQSQGWGRFAQANELQWRV